MVKRAAMAAVLAFCACSVWVANQTRECSAEVRCITGLECIEGFCVTPTTLDAGVAGNDPDCQDVYGSDVPGAVRLGAILSKTTATGAVDQRGVYRRRAMAVAITQVNDPANLASDDAPLFIRVCDDRGLQDLAAQKARELLDDGVVALITGGSSGTLAAANEAVPRRVLVLSISGSSSALATSGSVPDAGKLVWSAGISDETQAKVIVRLISPTASFGAIGRDITGFVTFHQYLNEAYRTEVDGGFVVLDTYPATSSPAVAVAKMIDAGVPATVVPLMPVGDSKGLFDAFTAAGVPDPRWVFTDNSRNAQLFDEPLSDGGRDSRLARLAGSRGTGPSVDVRSSSFLVFQARYVSTYSQDPLGASYVPNAYDAVLLLAGAAMWQRHSPNPGALPLARGLAALADPTGAAVLLDANELSTTVKAAFQQGRGVNVVGASGDLDFNPVTGITPSPVEEWELRLDAGFVPLRIWTQLPDGGLASRTP